VIRLRGRAVVYGELWFDETPPSDAGVDILVHRYRSTPLANAPATQLHSLQTDLAPPAEAIAARFEESCRRQVRRAARDDGLRYELVAQPAARLEEFAAFYDEFARQKGLWPADRHWLEQAVEARQLTLSCVSSEGERLVWHAHLTAGRIAQLAHSASLYRSLNAEQRTLIARANRWLHWQDLLAFKAGGALHYDWGGMFADESAPERAGINRFKRTFGGAPVLAYECSVPVTLRGRVWLTLRGALSRAAQRPRPAAASAA
jgi:hypothetical protein